HSYSPLPFPFYNYIIKNGSLFENKMHPRNEVSYGNFICFHFHTNSPLQHSFTTALSINHICYDRKYMHLMESRSIMKHFNSKVLSITIISYAILHFVTVFWENQLLLTLLSITGLIIFILGIAH